MTISTYFRDFRERLSAVYEPGEADAIADLIFEQYTHRDRNERLKEPDRELSMQMIMAVKKALEELLTHKPVQYVLQEVWFCGNKFYVDDSVLIPRPETELLVEEAVRLAKVLNKENIRILDIGTGSGCIPISIKKKIPAAELWAIDVSSNALVTAKKNADSLNTEIHFNEADITDETTWEDFPAFDIIVSNPPYILHSNLPEMSQNVTDFEPHVALFVPGNDALFFYRHITNFCKQKLLPGGSLLCEIHEDFGKDVAGLFEKEGFKDVTVLKDMFGKERVVEGILNNEQGIMNKEGI